MIQSRDDADTSRDRAEVLARLRPMVETALGADESVAFLARLERRFGDLYEPLARLFGAARAPELADRLVHVALAAAVARPEPLRALDRRREIDPEWFQAPSMLGYVAYTDRFAGTLAGVHDRLDHLAELGVTYLHLMPLLQPREGENDGGYAVADHRAVDPRLGTMDDLAALAAALRGRRMSLCIDLVLNHTAREHPWARGWLAGDPAYADFYLSFPDRTMPDAYESTVVDVFPDRAPGSFTRVEGKGWVWTTFFDYQWDLNWANPEVFAAVLDTVLYLANQGVEILRLDAVPFLAKRLGTPCLNLPEVHDLVQALRAASALAAPALVFKAEAIVAPHELVAYLGGHDRERPECELAYHNQLMVMLWSSLATKDARLAVRSLSRLRPIPRSTSWATYVRCHDDIGWAVGDADARAVGYDPTAHRDFLNAFYAGEHPFSFARGARFGHNAVTGDARISGSAAALCGITDAVERRDPAALELAERRFVLLHAVAWGWGGVPLLYMGDEIAQGNDAAWLDHPDTAHDNRWMHRPHFDADAATHRHDARTVGGRIFGWMCALSQARAATPALHAGGGGGVIEVDSPHVLAWWRRHPRTGAFVGLVNVTDLAVDVDARILDGVGGPGTETVLGSDGPPVVRQGRLHLPALSFLWVAER